MSPRTRRLLRPVQSLVAGIVIEAGTFSDMLDCTIYTDDDDEDRCKGPAVVVGHPDGGWRGVAACIWHWHVLNVR